MADSDIYIKEEIELEVSVGLDEEEFYEEFTQCEVNEENVYDTELSGDGHNYGMLIEAKKLERLILNLQNLDNYSTNFFHCHECSFEDRDQDSYLNHLDIHIKESFSDNGAENTSSKHFQCPKCTFKTYVGQKLLDHLKEHDKVEIICPNCPYETTNELLLFQHQKLVHPDNKDFMCLQCNFKVGNKEEFSRHLERHSGNMKCFACHHCDYKTDRKWNLTQHLLVHNDKNLRKFYCTNCSYIGYNKVSYLKHIKKHSSEEPLSCQFCNYQTYEKGALSQHVIIHNSEKRFQCPYCAYQSHRNWALKVHIKKRHCFGDVHLLEESINVPEEEVIHIIA